jgi:hypothetical protein
MYLADLRKYLFIKPIAVAAMMLLSCVSKPKKPIPAKPRAEEHEHNVKAVDTTAMLWRISRAEQIKLDFLAKSNPKTYARAILKQYALCNCFYQAFRRDSSFFSTDNSNGFLSREMIVHSRDDLDTVENIIKTYVSSIDSSFELESARPVSLFCLDLYESAFLDSLVRRYDSKIED